MIFLKGIANQFLPVFIQDPNSTDPGAGLTGETVSINLSLDGGAFAAAANAVTEVGKGRYGVTLTTAEIAIAELAGSLDVEAMSANGNTHNAFHSVIDPGYMWDQARTDHVIAGSFGEGILAESLNTQAKADVNAEADQALVDYDAVVPADLNDPTAATIADAVWDEARSGHVDAGSFGERVLSDVQAINSDTNVPEKLAKAISTMTLGTVDNATFTPTTTQFEVDDITEATANHFNGQIIKWLTGALAGQIAEITDYVLANAKGKFTVAMQNGDPMTEAPANDDTFIIL